jgi:uncharacterized membrane protein
MADPAMRNIRVVAGLERMARAGRSIGARVSEAVTQLAGSEWSVTVHAFWFAAWLVVNLRLTPWPAFDPFPFSLLTSIVSLEAIFLSLFVLASQNQLTRESEKRAHLDLQINLLAEQEMTVVLRMLKELCDRFDLTDTTKSEEFHALIERTDIRTLADRLERTLDPSPAAPHGRLHRSSTTVDRKSDAPRRAHHGKVK